MSESRFRNSLANIFPLLTSIVLGLFFLPFFFSSEPFHTWDLHGHIALTERLTEQLQHGRLFFFDPWWFTGWEAFRFYPPLGQVLAAAVSLLLSPVSSEPARLSCQFLSGLSLVLLPFAFFGLAKEILRIGGEDTTKRRILAACSSSLFACWFLSHPEYYYGLGADAGVRLGLFSQLLGWHLLLAYVKQVIRLGNAEHPALISHSNFRVALIVCLLILTHTLTFLFAAAFGALYLIWSGRARQLLESHIIGGGLSSFWLLPATFLGREYAPLDQLPAKGDFISLILQMTPQDMLQALRPEFAPSFSHMPLLLLCTLVTLPILSTRRHPHFLAALVFTVLAVSIFVSDAFSRNFPFSLHLYRFLGLGILVFIALLSAAPAFWTKKRYEAFCLVVILSLFEFQQLSLWKRVWPIPERGILKDEQAVLLSLRKSFREQSPTAEQRVLFELPAAGDTPDFPSPHYLPSALARESHRETGNGLFIQSSLSQAFLINSVSQLKIDYYGTPELDSSDETNTAADFAGQLRDLGISTIVSLKNEKKSLLAPVALGAPEKVGPFYIYELGPGASVLKAGEKHLIGYSDLEGSLPFKVVEYVFYSNKSLYQNAELIQIRADAAIPPDLDLILINSADKEKFEQFSTTLRANASRGISIGNLKFLDTNTDQVGSQQEKLSSLINNARRYLLGQLNLPNKISGMPAIKAPPSSLPKLQADWEGQRLTLSGLEPSRLYRLNYSYSPFWVSDQAEIYRGSAERMWILPKTSTVTLERSLLSLRTVQLGLFFSVSAFLFSFVLVLRPSDRDPS